MTAPDLPPLREVIARHGLSASKALGQNFLLDEQLLDRIAAAAGAGADIPVLEIGPGPGGLTRALLRSGARVIVIERDQRCIAALEELASAFPGQLSIHNGDALVPDPAWLPAGPYQIVSNLPYNIGTKLLTGWLGGPDWPPQWQSLTLMFQREVAERIVAPPGERHYGRLAILAGWRSQAKMVMKLHRSAFTPPPKVMSALVHIVPEAAPEGVRPELLERITAAAFGQRRKMLRQSLKGLAGALDALENLGIDPARRAETLDIEEYIALARQLSVIHNP